MIAFVRHKEFKLVFLKMFMDYLDLRYKEQVYVEAIRDGEIIRVPESVAIEDDLFILRKLSGAPQQQMTAAFAPVKKKEQSNQIGRNVSLFSEWKLGKFGIKKNNVIQDLVHNFHWEIVKQRRKKNLTRHKLAEMIRASENDVKMLELGELPADDFVLISRIEQLFGINLRKYGDSVASVNLADLQKRREEQDKKKAVAFSDDGKLAGNEIELVDE